MSRVVAIDPQRRVYAAERGVRVVAVGVRPPRIAVSSGSGGATYEHLQNAPASIWTVNHNLGFYPDVHVYTLGNLEILAEVQHISVNQTLVYFVAPTAGRARCS